MKKAFELAAGLGELWKRERWLAACIGLLVIVALSVPGNCAVVQDDFSGGLNSGLWYVTMTSAGMYSVDATNGDVRLAKIAPTPGGYRDVEINLNLANLTPTGTITGDFDIQVDFRDANIAGGGLNQVELHTGYTNGSIFYDVRDGGNVHVWTGSYQSALSTSATAGQFRIRRTGSTVTGYFNDQPIWSSGSYPAALSWVAFSLQNNAGSNDPISVTYDNFSISAADIIPPATLTGKVNLADYAVVATGIPVTVELDSTHSYTPVLNANGIFTISGVPSGTYDVRSKASHWLAKTIAGVTVTGSTDIGELTLINGDVDGDNEVTSTDLSILGLALGSTPSDASWDATADLDGDGEITSTDLSILGLALGMVGD